MIVNRRQPLHGSHPWVLKLAPPSLKICVEAHTEEQRACDISLPNPALHGEGGAAPDTGCLSTVHGLQQLDVTRGQASIQQCNEKRLMTHSVKRLLKVRRRHPHRHSMTAGFAQQELHADQGIINAKARPKATLIM
jgi:hypothetical protein